MLPGSVPIGRRLRNRYRVDGYLGGGQNGHVYEVWDTRQNQRAALKLLTTTPFGPWQEAEMLTGLDGKYILPILNADDEAGVPFLVTEVMEHGTLEGKIVSDIGAPVDRSAEWVRQACIGIARVHDRRLLHTDIKAGNLFLDEDDNVLVGDFGLACRMNSAGDGHGAGSPESMAPEVAAGQPTTVRSDVYSLGATLYYLLAGHWLNPSLKNLTNWGALQAAVAAHPAARPIGDVAPHVPIGLRAITMKAVAHDPADRFANPTDFAAALGARTRPRRSWDRDVPCATHTACFTGKRTGASTYKLCAVPTGVRDRHVIEVRRIPQNTRVLPWPEVAGRQVMARARARIAELT